MGVHNYNRHGRNYCGKCHMAPSHPIHGPVSAFNVWAWRQRGYGG